MYEGTVGEPARGCLWGAPYAACTMLHHAVLAISLTHTSPKKNNLAATARAPSGRWRPHGVTDAAPNTTGTRPQILTASAAGEFDSLGALVDWLCTDYTSRQSFTGLVANGWRKNSDGRWHCATIFSHSEFLMVHCFIYEETGDVARFLN